ncbi:hypothetical protein GpartN1_g5744.t1 [Galdieria partita]|uniref:Coatomer subunit beta n=1 Tax=Galdieria partita TaxID=83374 RepID=A0A9C7Q026_9RHOD|nr:hypothetical protein GpartN1_g5744.t1 [Galdieria partita]
MAALEKQCTLSVHYDRSTPNEVGELKKDLESNDVEKKTKALKRAILLQLNGEALPGVLMTVIRFILPHEDNHLRKLCLVYLEIVDKTGPQGKMLPEMILVCNMIRNELTHPNEYSRGCALRFVCKIKEAEILEPLVPAVRQNLEHRHSFVRRNAVLAVHMIFRNFEYLIPDAPELVYQFLQGETDVACKRNAFEMLCQCDEEKAVKYLVHSLEVVSSWGEILQLSALKLIRTICKSKPEEKATFIKLIFELLQSSCASVAFEAATTLFFLSQSTTAVRAAVECYCRLLLSQSDNNIRLILLDRLEEIRSSHPSVMQEVLFDMMRILSSPNLEIRKKVLSLASDLVTSRNAQPIINLIRKEIHGLATEVGDDFEVTLQYRQLLLRFIRNIAMNFPDCVALATSVLEEFVDDELAVVAPDAVVALREVAVKYPHLQSSIIERLGYIVTSGLRNPRVLRGIFWILAEFSSNSDQVTNSFHAVLTVVSPLPLSPQWSTETEVVSDVQSVSSDHSFHSVSSKKPKVLADGTYATQTVVEELVSGVERRDLSRQGAAVRSLILGGDYFLGVAVCSAMTKLALKSRKLLNKQASHKMIATSMLLCSSLLRFAQSSEAPAKMDSGSAERIILCILSLTGDVPGDLFLTSSHVAFEEYIKERRKKEDEKLREQAEKDHLQVDEPIEFRILRTQRQFGGLLDYSEHSVASKEWDPNFVEEEDERIEFDLTKVVQLTGRTDPVYAEAHVAVKQYDIILDILVMNQTTDTLQNLTVELATMGDLRLCERPQSHNIGPLDQRSIRTNIKVSSTEAGIIFGTIVYDIAGKASPSRSVILSDIHIDVMDYLHPGVVSDAVFRSLWAEFEWENKISIQTNMTDLGEYLDFVIRCTNMKCLTPRGLENESGFLAANLYATSIFGEDALLNVSAEKTAQGNIVGFIRIRSKMQGVALSLGDRISSRQNTVK